MATSGEAIRDQLLPLSKELADACVQEAAALSFDKTHPQHLYTVCAYGTVVEIAFGITALADARQTTGIPILLRTLLDAFATFRCCIKDPNHFKAMYASFAREKLRLLQATVESPDNPYLAGIAAQLNANVEAAQLEKQLADFRHQGYAPLKPWEEFQRADLKAEYQSLYWQLCMHAHNNVSVLEDRHLHKKDGDYEVAFFKDEDPADLARYLDSMCGVLIETSRSLHGLLESGRAATFEVLADKLKGIRSSYAGTNEQK